MTQGREKLKESKYISPYMHYAGNRRDVFIVTGSVCAVNKSVCFWRKWMWMLRALNEFY